jgi:hypothetical protein
VAVDGAIDVLADTLMMLVGERVARVGDDTCLRARSKP